MTALPNPTTLLSGLLTLERTLASLEAGFAAQTHTATSSDNNIRAVANGVGRLVSLFINPSVASSLASSTLATRVKDVINAALTASNTATQAAMANAAKTLSIPGLPAQGQTPPAYTAFAATASALASKIVAADPCDTTALFTCTSGSVTAVVSGRRLIVSLTYPSPLPTFVPHLEDNTVDAVNCAIDKATDRADDTASTVDKITGGSATFQNLVLYASNLLDIEHDVTIRDAAGTGYGSIGNAGTFLTDVDHDSHVGNISSRAPVQLGLHAHVHGFIRTASTVSGKSGADITGPVIENAVVILPDLVLKVAFPSTNKGQLVVGINKQATAAPGYYTKIDVELGATLNVSSGVYFCDDFDLDDGAKIVVNASQGPIFFYVKNTFTFNGAFVDSAGGFPNVFVGYVGSLTIFLNKPFSGTLVAPNAKIDLQTVASPGHAGAFHAKDVEVDPNNTIQHHPFPMAYENLPGLVSP